MTQIYEILLNINPNIEILIINISKICISIEDPDLFEQFNNDGKVIVAPAGTNADFFILKFAQMYQNAVIISNDRFKEYMEIFKEACMRRIPFMIIKDEIIFYQEVGE